MSNIGDRGSGIGDQGSGIGDRSGDGGRLDLAIALAVREMLDVEPPSGLRGRVLDRIDALSTSSALSPNSVVSGFSRKTWWIAAPVAAAAVILFAVLAPWRQATPHVEPSAAPSIAQVTPAPVLPPVTSRIPESPRTASHPASLAAPSGPRPSPRAIEDRLVVATLAADDNPNVGIDPLAPIAPITVGAARPQDIAPKDIAISPLAPIAGLQIAPLSPPDRRN